MVRQAQTYFNAAIWAAVLNAAAIAAFVLFMMLSSVHGWPLRTLLGLADPPGSGPAHSVPTSFAQPVPGHFGKGGLFGARALNLGPQSTGGGGSDPAANTKLSGTNGFGSPKGAGDPSGSPAAPAPTPTGAGGPGPSGAGGAGPSGPSGGGSSLVPTPSPAPPPPVGPALQGVTGTVGGVAGSVSGAPATVGGTIGSTVSSADSQLGGALSSSGVRGAVQGATRTLTGRGSAAGVAGQATATGAAGSALQGLEAQALGAG